MTDQELRDLVANLSASTAELRAAQAESQREQANSRKELDETWQQIRRVDKQLGELGNRFGGFTEGMAWPSVAKILYQEFGMNDVSLRRQARLNGETLEIDVLAYDNTGARDEVFIVEIKSRLTPEAITQIHKTIAAFPRFFPQLKERKIYGIIAAVDIPENLRQKVLQNGFYLARISDETFKLQVPRGFKPKAFGPAANGNGHKKNGAKKRATK